MATRGGTALHGPSYLRYWVLLLFFTLFIVLIVALEILLWYSLKHHGILASTEDRHYLWTYGPTTILTLVAAYWGRIDYQLRASAPWWQLAQGPKSAQRSILLDYVSPLLPSYLYRALRNGHLAIAVSVTTALLLKVLIIISTSLMSLDAQTVSYQNHTLTTSSTFMDDAVALQHIGDSPYKTINGIQTQNLSYPLGATKDFAYQIFQLDPGFEDSVSSGVVDAYYGDLDCELATIEVNDLFWAIPYGTPASVEPQLVSNQHIYTTDCNTSAQITDIRLYYEGTNGGFDYLGTDGQRQIYAIFTNGSCGGSTAKEDQRLVIGMGELIQGPEIGYITNMSAWPQYGGEAEVYMNITTSATFLCRPTYWLQKIHLSMNMSQQAPVPSPVLTNVSNAQIRTLPHVDPWDIAQAQFNTYGWAEGVVGPNGFEAWQDGGVTVQYGSTVTPIIWGMTPPQMIFGAKQEGIVNVTTDDIDGDLVLRIGRSYWKTYTALIAQKYLMTGPSDQVLGTVSVQKLRLVVHNLPVRLMQGILGVMALSVVPILIYLKKQQGILKHPKTLGEFATVAANSSDLMKIITIANPVGQTGSIPNGFSDCEFTTKSPDSQALTIAVSQRNGEEPFGYTRTYAKGKSWFQPLPLRLVFRLSIGIIIVCFMVVLEVLLHLSNQHQGLGNIGDDDRVHYTWTLVPAALLSLLGLYVAAFDFGFKTLAPYHKLHREASFRQAMSVNFLNQIAGRALVTALRFGHVAVVFTTTATILGLFLTIIVSGIFAPITVPLTSTTSAIQTSWFNESIDPQYGYFGAGMSVANLVIHNNFSQPLWTYNGLAFASFTHDSNNTNQSNSTNRAITIKLPTLRPRLTCTLLPDMQSFCTNTTWNGTEYPEIGNHLALFMLGHYDTNCSLEYHGATIPIAEDKYFGTFLNYGDAGGGSYVWGRYTGSTLTHIAGINCTESVDELDVTTQFRLPSYDIDVSVTPIPDVGSIKNSSITLLENVPSFLSNLGVNQELDYVFQAAVYGVDGVAIEHLSSSTGNQKVMERLINLTTMYRAIQYSTDARLKNNNTAAATTSATLLELNNQRLLQNAVSTHILVVLLGLILLCMIAASILMPTGRLVPFEPSSIAAVLNFFVGSNILELARRRYINGGLLDENRSVGTKTRQEFLFGIKDLRSEVETTHAGKKRSSNKSAYSAVIETEAMEVNPGRFTIVVLEPEDHESQPFSSMYPIDEDREHDSVKVPATTVVPAPERAREDGPPPMRVSTVSNYTNDMRRSEDISEAQYANVPLIYSPSISISPVRRFPSLASQRQEYKALAQDDEAQRNSRAIRRKPLPSGRP